MHHVAAVNDMGGNDSGFLICPPESTCIFLEWKMGLTLIFVTFFVTLKLKKALQISVTPFSAEREGLAPLRRSFPILLAGEALAATEAQSLRL